MCRRVLGATTGVRRVPWSSTLGLVRSGGLQPTVVKTRERLKASGAEEPRRGGEGARYINRELSWLDFNERVLALAEEERRPLLERAKLAAIFSSNLDEFFQIRVSGLMEQLDAGWTTPSP